MNITKDMKMADVIHLNYALLPVISRFKIELGFGDKTVKEVCEDFGVNLDFFIEITNSFINEEYIPQIELSSFPVSLIVDYLKKTHEYYLLEKFPELEKMINNMVSQSGTDLDISRLVIDFFIEYKNELTNHIEREEDRIQPYVLEVEKAYESKIITKELIQKIKTYSINDFAIDHDNVEEKLYDLKNIIIKYLPPCADSSLCNKILMELFRLEKDLNAHAVLEDKVLVPKVSLMEKSIINSERK